MSNDKLRECDNDKGGDEVNKSEIFADVMYEWSSSRDFAKIMCGRGRKEPQKKVETMTKPVAILYL